MAKESRKKEPLRDESNLSGLSDWLRKTLMTGVGAVFMTEEGIRNSLSELKMPKSVISAAIAQADKTKQDISKLVAKELRNFLEGIELSEIIKKILTGQSLEISASIRFKPHNQNMSKKKTASKKAAQQD